MKVLFAESSYPEEFYRRRLDGNSTAGLLDTMGINSKLRYVLVFELLKRAIDECANGNFQVLHLSCHGDEKSIVLTNNHQPV